MTLTASNHTKNVAAVLLTVILSVPLVVGMVAAAITGAFLFGWNLAAEMLRNMQS